MNDLTKLTKRLAELREAATAGEWTLRTDFNIPHKWNRFVAAPDADAAVCQLALRHDGMLVTYAANKAAAIHAAACELEQQHRDTLAELERLRGENGKFKTMLVDFCGEAAAVALEHELPVTHSLVETHERIFAALTADAKAVSP
jgi:hypothetical protein